MKRTPLRRKAPLQRKTPLPRSGWLKRTPIKRTYRGHKDPVTPDVATQVFVRDGWRCVAPVVDPEAGPCRGRITIEHVKAAARMGHRAESVVHRLVSLCEGHTEPGMKAGYVWNTAHKDDLRAYLVSKHPPQPLDE